MNEPGIDAFTKSAPASGQSGATLYEALLSAAFMAFAALAMLGLYTLARANWKDDRALEMLSTVRVEIENVHDKPYYGREGTDMLPLLVSLKTFPKKQFDAKGRLVNPWGGTVAVVSMGSRFRVTFADVPGSGCQQLAKAFEKRDNAFISFEANGEMFIPGEDIITPLTVPCSKDGNALAWEFGIPSRRTAITAASAMPPRVQPGVSPLSAAPPQDPPDGCTGDAPSYEAATFVLDDSGSMRERASNGRGSRWDEALIALQQLISGPGPSALNVTAMADKAKCSDSGGQPSCDAQLTLQGLTSETIPAARNKSSNVYDTVFLAAQALAAGGLGTEKPAAIVVYSDGLDYRNSGIGLNTLTAYLRANYPNLSVNVVDVAGKVPDFRKLAEETGGQYILVQPETDVTDLFRRFSGSCGTG